MDHETLVLQHARTWILAVLLFVVCGARSASVADELVVGAQEIHDAVSVTIDAGADGSFTGVLTNSGTQPVRDVRLLVRHSWLWKNERNPGSVADNPARAAYYLVDGVVPAGGELKFRYAPNPPLPERTDGRFVTAASIVGLTEVGAPQE